MPRSAPMPPARPRVTREDWLAAAREVLVSHGVAEVKVLTLGRTLGSTLIIVCIPISEWNW